MYSIGNTCSHIDLLLMTSIHFIISFIIHFTNNVLFHCRVWYLMELSVPTLAPNIADSVLATWSIVITVSHTHFGCICMVKVVEELPTLVMQVSQVILFCPMEGRPRLPGE